jgi:hypothetical protein
MWEHKNESKPNVVTRILCSKACHGKSFGINKMLLSADEFVTWIEAICPITKRQTPTDQQLLEQADDRIQSNYHCDTFENKPEIRSFICHSRERIQQSSAYLDLSYSHGLINQLIDELTETSIEPMLIIREFIGNWFSSLPNGSTLNYETSCVSERICVSISFPGTNMPAIQIYDNNTSNEWTSSTPQHTNRISAN